MTWGLGLLAVAGALLAGAVAVLARAGWLRRQPARRLFLLPAVFAGTGAAIVAVVLVPNLGDGRERADCATFTVRRARLDLAGPRRAAAQCRGDRAAAMPLAGDDARRTSRRQLGSPPAQDTRPPTPR